MRPHNFMLLFIVVVLNIMLAQCEGPRGPRCVSSPACICRRADVLCWDQRR